MAFIFEINKRSNNLNLKQQKIQWDCINFQLCTEYLRKVSLKVDDVKMKLGLKKIINFLERQNQHEICNKKGILKSHQNQMILKNNYANKGDHEEQMIFHQKLTQQNKPVTFVSVQTSKSLADETLLIKEYEYMGKQNHIDGSHFSHLNYKHVVTKNDLFLHTHKGMEVESHHFELEELQEENKMLGNCLKKIFSLLEEKKIIDLNKSMQKHKKDSYSNVVEIISKNFQSYQEQIQSRINQLTQYTKQLQKSLNLYNISINNRLQLQKSLKNSQNSAQKQESIVFQSKQIQVESIKSINQSEVQIKLQREEYDDYIQKYNQIKEQMQKALQKIQSYEKIICSKDEQISSLNMKIKDLKDKIEEQRKPIEVTTNKKYKKFFQFTGQNFNKTVV